MKHKSVSTSGLTAKATSDAALRACQCVGQLLCATQVDHIRGLSAATRHKWLRQVRHTCFKSDMAGSTTGASTLTTST